MEILLAIIAISRTIGFAIGRNLRTKRKFERLDIDNIGEQKVILKLFENFSKKENYLINDITIPTEEKGSSQIDHVLINKYGIFVIETKNYSGIVFGNKKDYKWTQAFSRNEKYRFYNTIRQNENHIKHLKNYLSLIKGNQIISIIVFTGDAKINCKETNVIYLNGLINYINTFKQERLTLNEINLKIGKIEYYRKERNAKTNIEHIEHVKRKKSTKRQRYSSLKSFIVNL